MKNQRELQSLSLTHKASASLHSALKQERVTTKNFLSSVGKQVIGKVKTTAAVTDFIDRRDAKEAILGEVRGLSNYKTAESNERIETMIAKQKNTRRNRHLNLLREFEGWVEALYENITRSGNELIKKWQLFSTASEQELAIMMQGFKDEELLTTELEYISAAFDNVKNHLIKREEESYAMTNALYKLEEDRKSSVEKFLQMLKTQLQDIAFMLEPEVIELVEDRKEKLLSDMAEREDVIISLLNNTRMGEEELRFEYREKILERELKWKVLHHEEVLSHFHSEMSSKEFTNPPKRIKLYEDLKECQIEVFNSRVSHIEELTHLSLDTLSENKVQSFIDQLNLINDNAQRAFDEHIQRIISLQQTVDSDIDDLLEVTQDKIEHYKAPIEYESVTDLMQTECFPKANALKEGSKELLTKAIKYLEDSDTRSHDVSMNLSKFILELGKITDQHRTTFSNEEMNYNMQIASRGDELDDNIEKLEDNLKEEHKALINTVTQEELDGKLQDCFGLFEEIQKEYTAYTEDTGALISSHSNLLSNIFDVFLDNIGQKYGISLMSKQEDFINQIRDKKLREFEEERRIQQEENKKRAPKKEEEFVFEPPEFEEIEACNHQWFIKADFGEILKDLMTTEEDKEAEIRKKELELQKQKEREAAEEARKKEEAKKPKGKRVVEEPKPEEEEAKEEEVAEEENSVPTDPDGGACLSPHVFITKEMAMDWLVDFRAFTVEILDQQRSKTIEESEVVDSEKQENLTKELENHLEVIPPRKEELQKGDYAMRTIDIKRHQRRYERYEESFRNKMQKFAEEFEQLQEAGKGVISKYISDISELQKSLALGNSLAELQGTLRKAKDLELFMFQNCQKILERMYEISHEEAENIRKQNSLFIASLTLIEDGGNYSQKEVDHYGGNINQLNEELDQSKEQQDKIAESFRAETEKERQGPIEAFEKEYAVALENFAAKAGTGKKYGAPQRSAQEKLRGEMTKCEKAQDGINITIDKVAGFVEEFISLRQSHNERSPSLNFEIRRYFISLRICMNRLGSHLAGYKEEPQQLKSITWEETNHEVAPNPNETKEEAERMEWLLEPLYELGVQKQGGNFSQRVLEIEKLAREECMKLYQGKSSALPDFMEKYLRTMKENSEKFRLNQIKSLRMSAERLLQLAEQVPLVIYESFTIGCLQIFDSSISDLRNKISESLTANEKTKKINNHKLRPNLSNPEIRSELEELDQADKDRSAAYLESIENFKNTLNEILNNSSQDFRTRLVNNTEAFVYILDNLFVGADFIMLPGDEQVEAKRNNIKRLARKKKSGKASEVVGPRGYKKAWPGLPINFLENSDESAAITTFKMPMHKALFKSRNDHFASFNQQFMSAHQEFTDWLSSLQSTEEKWAAEWEKKVEYLKNKQSQ